MDFDAVTLAPYMGSDSIRPFLKREGRWGIVLAMTSNKSAEEFETLTVCSASGHSHPDTAPMPLYERIIRDTVSSVDSEFGDSRSRLMFVVGATRPEKLAEIRRYCPDHFFLVPGVGAQGGSLEEVARHGLNSHCGLLAASTPTAACWSTPPAASSTPLPEKTSRRPPELLPPTLPHRCTRSFGSLHRRSSRPNPAARTFCTTSRLTTSYENSMCFHPI